MVLDLLALLMGGQEPAQVTYKITQRLFLSMMDELRT